MSGPAPSRRVLLLCLHNHQPVGNFDSVIEGAARDAYLPFLQTLADFPSVKVTIHFSGFLLLWLAERSPDTFSLLKALSDRGQAEVLGGGCTSRSSRCCRSGTVWDRSRRWRPRCCLLYTSDAADE